MVVKCDLMGSLGQQKSYHSAADQNDLRRLSVDGGAPISVLRDGGVENAVAVTHDGSLHVCVAKGCQFHCGGGQNPVSGTEEFFIQNACMQGNGTFLIGVTDQTYLDYFAGLHLTYRKGLRDAVGFVVQFYTILPEGELVAF